MRLISIALVLAALVIAGFVAWGGDFEAWFTGDAAVQWVQGWGAWGAVAVIALLLSDLFLPVPATAVMAATGFLYGPWLGGAINAVGSFCAGWLAYGLCSRLGHAAARRLVGAADLTRGERLFATEGAWLVAISRALPVLPEVVACLAGLARMRRRKFTLALACGSVPVGFVYAAIGAAGQERPGLALALSVLLPAALWWPVRRWMATDDPAVPK